MNDIIILTIKRLNDLGVFKYVDEDWGQLQEDKEPVRWPCALVSLDRVDFSGVGRDERKLPISRQLGETRLDIIVADMKVNRKNPNAPKTNQRVNGLDLINKVHEALQGQKAIEGATSMNRVEFYNEKLYGGKISYRITYEFNYDF